MENFIGNVQEIISVGEVVEQGNIFLEVKMCMFDTKVNLNKVRFTPALLESVVANKEKYICLPLLCDVDALFEDEEMGHLLDAETGKFGTLQIGSFRDFEIEGTGEEMRLIGYARVPKRNDEICAALRDLHKDGKLSFSYEIVAMDYVMENGVTTIDESENNYLIGFAVVTYPACVSATSLMVAQNQAKGGENLDTVNLFIAELEFNQIKDKLYGALKEYAKEKMVGVDPYEVNPCFVFANFVIAHTWSDGDFYAFKYDVVDGEVEIIEHKKFEFTYPEETISMAEHEQKVAELNQSLIDMGEQLNTVVAERDALLPFKAQVEALEIEKAECERKEKVGALREKAAKVLDEEEMVVIAEAIEALDENAVNTAIATKYIAVASVAKTDDNFRMTDGLVNPEAETKYFSLN